MFDLCKRWFRPRLTVADAVRMYVMWCLGDGNRSKATLQRYVECFPEFIGSVGPDKDFRRLTHDDVTAYCIRLKETHKKSNVMNHMGAVVSFLRWQSERGNTELKVDAIKVPRVKARSQAYTKPGEVWEMLKGIKGDDFFARRDRAILALMGDTGIRNGEVRSLTRSDIDLDAKVGHVVGSKTGKEREIRWSDEANVILRAYCEMRGFVARSEYMFVANSGRNMGGMMSAVAIGEVIAETRLRPEVTPHSLRRGFGTSGDEAGTSPFVLKDMLGHADISTTQLYVKICQPRVNDAYKSIWKAVHNHNTIA